MAMDENGSGISHGLNLETFPYGVPNYRHTINYVPFHVPVAVRRDDGQPSLFFRESFIDELAHAVGRDPYQYRRELISRGTYNAAYKQDILRAIDTAAKLSEWQTPLSAGSGLGMAVNAVTTGVGYIQCQACRVTVSRQGGVRLNRVDVAADEGFGAVNPLSFKKQIEGAINWEIDDLFTDEFVVRDGKMITNSFDTVFTGRMSMYPREINISLFKSNRWATGPTEGMSSLQAAIVNALHRATGKRIRTTPLKNHDLSWA
jgi:isoquinoline 1-oxidoreductase beta subunit